MASGRGLKKPEGADWLEGTGVALTMLASGPPTEHRSGATVALLSDGTYHLAVGSTEMGNGITTAHHQMAATILGSKAEAQSISSTPTPTRRAPYDTGTFASTGTGVVAGRAVVSASEVLRDRINEFASRQLGVDVPDYAASRPTAVVADSQRISLADSACRVGEFGLRARRNAQGLRLSAHDRVQRARDTISQCTG